MLPQVSWSIFETSPKPFSISTVTTQEGNEFEDSMFTGLWQITEASTHALFSNCAIHCECAVVDPSSLNTKMRQKSWQYYRGSKLISCRKKLIFFRLSNMHIIEIEINTENIICISWPIIQWLCFDDCISFYIT